MLLTLLIISTLMIGLMFAINSWSFSRGFLGYINRLEVQRLEPMIDALSERYALEGGWDWLLNDKRALRDLHAEHVLGRARGGRRDREPKQPKSGPRSPRNDGDSDRAGRRANADGNPPLTYDPRVLIADADLQILIGRQRGAEDVLWQEVKVERQIVGFLGIQRANRATAQLDRVFEQQQKKAFGYAALIMFGVSALLSIPLAARVVKPLLRVNSAVDQISQGRFEHRLTMNRRDEFGDLARNINHLGETLEKNLAARQRWIAEISHELRTPVAVLRAELEALQDGVRQFNDQTLESLHAEALRLHRLINDLHDLSLSDLGALNFQMEALDLSAVVNEFLHSHADSTDAANLSVDMQSEPAPSIISGDRQRIDQLLGNLLQNSQRYTDAGGKIAVKIDANAHRVHLIWEDSSPGVSDAQLPHLFDALYRVEESRNRASGGAGLGLSIVKKLVDAHSGTITASHSALGGLRLDLELPTRMGTMP